MRPRRVLLWLAGSISIVWTMTAVLGMVLTWGWVSGANGSRTFIMVFAVLALPGMASVILCEKALRKDLKQEGEEGLGFPILDQDPSPRSINTNKPAQR